MRRSCQHRQARFAEFPGSFRIAIVRNPDGIESQLLQRGKVLCVIRSQPQDRRLPIEQKRIQFHINRDKAPFCWLGSCLRGSRLSDCQQLRGRMNHWTKICRSDIEIRFAGRRFGQQRQSENHRVLSSQVSPIQFSSQSAKLSFHSFLRGGDIQGLPGLAISQ